MTTPLSEKLGLSKIYEKADTSEEMEYAAGYNDVIDDLNSLKPDAERLSRILVDQWFSKDQHPLEASKYIIDHIQEWIVKEDKNG